MQHPGHTPALPQQPSRPHPARLLALLGHPDAAASAPVPVPVPDGRFAAQGDLPAGALRAVEIEDVGVMDGPLDPDAIEQLEAACTPAPFGWRDQTLLDSSVRHTGEIDADRLSLSWQGDAFIQLQQRAAQALGLPALEAHLHNLLVYGPGQFFKPHQDTQKHPRMIGTLVLVWPCAHTGGVLRVWHGAQERVLASAQAEGDTALRWFAFYADCRHEVQPVETGWRVALTFDLVLPATVPAQPAPTLEPARQHALEAALRAQFGLEDPVQSAATAQHPWALLLDHEYTEHGLRWELLKGEDRWRVAVRL